MYIIVTTGGSGGHIYPALSVMNRLEELGHRVVFVGRKEGLEKKIVKDFEYIDIDVIGFKGLSITSFKAYTLMKKAQKMLSTRFKEEKPDLVIGFGNYVSAPAINAALKLGIKTIVHEQNFELGRYNRLIAGKVSKLLTSYDDYKGIFVGNPRSEEFYLNYKKQFHPGCNVLMFAGSQGSEVFCDFLIKNYKEIEKLKCNFHFVTGKRHYESTIRANIRCHNIFVYEYIEDMVSFIADKDICITRAGATTISELSVIGMPLILIPSPYVTNNHQYLNAKELADKGACVLVKESEMDVLLERLSELIAQDRYLLQRNIKTMSKQNSIKLFIEQVEALLKE